MRLIVFSTLFVLIQALSLDSIVYSNVVSNTINQFIQNKTDGNNSISIKNNNKIISEKYHTFDAVNHTFAFVIFYRSTCPHCQRFVPILSQFAHDFGFRIYAYTTDGGVLPEIPNSMPMTKAIESTFFSTPDIEVPSFFLINVKTMQAYLIDQGEMSYQDLEVRLQSFFQMGISQEGVPQ